MADAMSSLGDSLTQLRQSIASSTPPTLTPSDDLAHATHLTFSAPTAASYPLDTPTRFTSSGEAVDLRSIFFAWRNKDAAITDYISLAQSLNDALAAEGGAGGKVRNLVFVERLDLITWLEGASNTSEFIKPLESDNAAAQAAGSAQIASGAAGGASALSGAAGAQQGRTTDPRLREIYNNERRMGDRNSVLRGIKPTDFSHVRKSADAYLKAHRANNKTSSTAPSSAPTATLTSRGKQRRIDPIILLSPSASSLLRMSNIKSFLNDGVYTPPDSTAFTETVNVLHVTRTIPSVDPSRTQRFILTDSTDQFKPDYWSRVVAVFTTGQAWQFKGYKWQAPQELFNHVLGVHLGWKGEQPPETIRNWGRGVANLQVEKWRGEGIGRWRDREVVEALWDRIEESMKRNGWGSSGPSAR